MHARLRSFVLPAYVLLCLLLGGSVQGVWRVMILQLLAVGLIAWAAVTRKQEPLAAPARLLLLLAILLLLLVVLQLVPLPPEVWTSLPGREVIENGYASLGYALPWLPVSMAPYDTLATSLTLLPPIAVLAGMLRLHAYEESWLAAAIIFGTLLAVLLGAIQSLGGPGAQAWWFLYEHTNSGAVGFFANRSHMGTLLLVSIPFAMALIASGKPKAAGRGRVHGLTAAGAGGLLLIIVGLILNRSSAAISLALPVLAFSALMLPVDWRSRRLILAAAAIFSIVAVVLFTSTPIQSEIAGTDTTSFETRRWMWGVSWSVLSDTFPLGTGLGSFEQVFGIHEDPGSVDAVYVNHAHNDYLEVMVEAGLAGLLLMAAFLIWWAIQLVRVWKSPLSSQVARAATIVSGAILAHSFVEYPLRTAAIAAVFAACIGLMAKPWRLAGADATADAAAAADAEGEPRGARHLKIG